MCVLTEVVLGQGRMGELGEDVLLDSCLLEQYRILELGSVCVLKESVLGQGRMWEWSEVVLFDSCLL